MPRTMKILVRVHRVEGETRADMTKGRNARLFTLEASVCGTNTSNGRAVDQPPLIIVIPSSYILLALPLIGGSDVRT